MSTGVALELPVLIIKIIKPLDIIDQTVMASIDEREERLHLLSNAKDNDNRTPEIRHARANTTMRSMSLKLQRCFLVEPILIVYFFCEFPVGIICQRYILDWVTVDRLERDAALNISHDANKTMTPCDANISKNDYEFQQSVQSASSFFLLTESIVYGTPAVFVTLFLGAGSDKIGRRFAILPPLLGTILKSSVATLIVWYKASIYWFYLGDALYGVCGSFSAMIMGCYAFVADRTPPENRMLRITIVDMCILSAGVVSPILLGLVITKIGYVIPMLVVVGLSAINLIYVFAFLPNDKARIRSEEETPEITEVHPYSSSPQRFSSWLRLLWAQVRSTLSMFTRSTEGATLGLFSRRFKLTLLMGTFFIANLPTFAYSIVNLFLMNSPLCWGIDRIGLFSGVATGVAAVGAMIITPLLKCCRTPDYFIAIMAVLAQLATNVYKYFVSSTIMMFLSISLSMFAILFIPSLRALMSSQVNEKEQGSIFGAIACVEVFCLVCGNVLFNSIYSVTVFTSTGFVFVVMALFYAIGIILMSVYMILIKVEDREIARNTSRQVLVEDSNMGIESAE